MPKAAKHFALSRQWQMLNMIPTRMPGITARELTERLRGEGFAVTRRTVERDLVELSAQFAIRPQSATGKPPFHWNFIPGKKCDIGSIELVDALSLALAGDVLDQMLPAPFLGALAGKIEQARGKLRALRGHPLAKWSQKVRFVPPTLALQPPRVSQIVLETVQQALIGERQLEVRYAAFNEKPRQMTLHPLSLVLRGTVPYLVATVHSYPDVRLFAIHRMQAATCTPLPAQAPEGYSVDDYIGQGAMEFTSGGILKLKARLTNELAQYLSETPLAADQQIRYRAAHWQLAASVRDSWQLRFWILSQGSGIEVLAPKQLRKEIAAELMDACKPYAAVAPN